MDPAGEQSVIRQHDRRACKLAAIVRVALTHATVVCFARSVGDGTGAVAATVVDVSNGGLGLECQHFLPRGTTLLVCVQLEDRSTPLEVPARVQRVNMISRTPRFYLGLAYAGSPADRPASLGALLNHVSLAAAAQEAGRC